MRRVAYATALIMSLLIAAGCGSGRGGSEAHNVVGSSAEASTSWPRITLWAWQRPNDLSFIDPRRIGISYLVETVRLGGTGVVVDPNANGIRVPAGTWLMACARIEMDSGYSPPPSLQEPRKIASLLSSLAHFPGAKAVQIDFDATVSQRDFYRNLLIQLRRRLPLSLPISITSLASWCEGDDWISQLPVSEAVPMLFRMSADRTPILLRLQAGNDFQEPLCRKSAGISTDEFVPRLPSGRRLYVFNPEGWTSASFKTIMTKTRR